MRDRAVSTVLGYTLALGIAALLVVGLLTAAGTFVETQRDTVVDSELRVIGERIAGDLAAADRLVRRGEGPTNATVVSRLPASVAGSDYTVEIDADGGNATVELTATSTERAVTVRSANTTALEPTRVRGGDLRIAYNRTADRLEVTGA